MTWVYDNKKINFFISIFIYKLNFFILNLYILKNINESVLNLMNALCISFKANVYGGHSTHEIIMNLL